MPGCLSPSNPVEQQIMNDVRLAKSLYFVIAGFYNCGAVPALLEQCQHQRDLQLRVISTASGIRKFPFDLEQYLDQDYKSIRLLREEHLFPQPFLHMVFDQGSCTVRLPEMKDQWGLSSADFLQQLNESHIRYSDKQNPEAQYQLAKLMDESYLLTLSELTGYQQSFRNQLNSVCA